MGIDLYRAFGIAFIVALELQFIGGCASSQTSAYGITIVGSDEFRTNICGSLDLLASRDLNGFAVVQRHIGRIVEGERSCVFPWAEPPTIVLSPKTAYFSRTWCSSVFVHEAIHCQIYAENIGGPLVASHSKRSIKLEELTCMSHQVNSLKAIGAPASEIAYAESCDGTHRDVDRDGVVDWGDFSKGDW